MLSYDIPIVVLRQTGGSEARMDMKAFVDRDKFFLPVDADIQEGDHVEQQLPNGRTRMVLIVRVDTFQSPFGSTELDHAEATYKPVPARPMPAVARTSRYPQAGPLRILYLTAASRGDLRVDEEMRRVKAGVRAATHRDWVQIEHKSAATVSDLLDGLTQFKPHVVHFSGHANESVLVFDTGSDQRGPGRSVPADTIARAIGAVDVPPALVVFNACRSESQLAGLLGAAPLAIGMRDSVGDADAMAFAARFYAAVADGQSVEGAYRVAKVALELSGFPDAELPVLVHAPAVNPADVVLVVSAQ